MHIHILGICGTFMGSLALLARELGHTVTGSDANVYPPMSTQLERAGVTICEGYLVEHIQPAPDLVVVGNAMKRGMAVVEYMLNEGMRYTSGPQFLSETVLQSRHVLAVAGTHGKTTTTTMLAWILHFAGIDTGFLIGGVPLVDTTDKQLQQVFAHSSYLGDDYNVNCQGDKKAGYFVIEADEYDSAFFDKRSKFVHYRPQTAILNNLEFDHADIFDDLEAIQTQFHHMIRMIPSDGKIIMPSHTQSLEDTLNKGHWTPVWRTAIDDHLDHNEIINYEKKEDKNAQNGIATSHQNDWQATLLSADGSHFDICFNDHSNQTSNQISNETPTPSQSATVKWSMSGLHNVNNALVAVAAAFNVGVDVATACAALSAFAGIKRRMELIGNVNDILVFDDFAHHPTAISTTLDGAKKKLTGRRIWAIIEPRSNTMKMGIHKDSLAHSAALADHTIWYEPAGLEWGLKSVIEAAIVDTAAQGRQHVLNSTDAIIQHICTHAVAGDAVIIMSNGGFDGIHQRLLSALISNG